MLGHWRDIGHTDGDDARAAPFHFIDSEPWPWECGQQLGNPLCPLLTPFSGGAIKSSTYPEIAFMGGGLEDLHGGSG